MKKYIALFTGYYYPHLGGVEKYNSALAKELLELGYNPIVITSNYNNDKNFEIINGITILRLPVYSIFSKRYPIIKFSKEYKILMQKLNEFNIIAIIVNTRFYLTSHIGANFGKRKSIPVYLIEHGSNYVTLNNKIIDFFANRYEDILTFFIKKKINGFYGVSNACAKWLNHFNIKASGVWYNSIDCSQNVPSRIKHNGINFMYAGRIISQKGIENILDAFSELEKKYNNINLYIAGDGEKLKEYKQNFVSKRIKFLGNLDYEKLKKYYLKTDVFLCPSLYPEGLPTSILEAGLMGCAVITTDAGGTTEIINKNNGIIVEKNKESLYSAMEFLINNEDRIKELSKKLNSDVKRFFSWEMSTKKILKDIGVE